ncbi:MAG: UV DNA damage endonuclease [Gemmatales bacterium]|nr:MAG: UV DNA damage endonuclease [Gemmatales bacterium]
MNRKRTEESEAGSIRLGLCCAFRKQPIKFRTTTAAAVSRMSKLNRLQKLAELCLYNADSLFMALRFCAENGIGCFRINSQILPLRTHPAYGYELRELPDGDEIISRFKNCGQFARQHGLRISFHPDQFVVLNSQNPKVVASSLAELEYQAEVAEWVGADVINIHGGGAYGNKAKALAEFARNLDRLSLRARRRLAIENDDRIFAPAQLLPLCRHHQIPLVYDVHHHRCNPDGLSEAAATEQALETWNREPLFHISSPLEGWRGPKPQRHHNYINVRDFPECWHGLDVTIEVEAKAKELAVLRLARWLKHRRNRQTNE